MGGCQNYDPFLGTLNIRCRICNKDPKRDPNIDNHPMDFGIEFGIPDDGTSAGLLQHGGSSRALPVEET